MHVVASNPRGEEKTKGKVGVGDCRRQKMRRPISTALDDDACRECGSPDEETEPLYERRKGRATPAHTGSTPGLKWRGLAHHRQAITATKGLGDVPRCQGGGCLLLLLLCSGKKSSLVARHVAKSGPRRSVWLVQQRTDVVPVAVPSTQVGGV